jgi:hypothetical protein
MVGGDLLINNVAGLALIFDLFPTCCQPDPIPPVRRKGISLNVGKGAGSGIVLEKAANLAGARSPQSCIG